MQIIEPKRSGELYDTLRSILNGVNELVKGMTEDGHWYPPYVLEELEAMHSMLDDAVDEHFLVKEM